MNKKYIYNENFFEKENEFSYYWAGFLAADGSVNKKSLYLQLAEKDLDHLNKFKEIICNNAKIVKYKTKLNNKEFISYRISIFNKSIINSLKKFNIIQNKTKTYSLPTLNENLIRHFIRGYFDGDGSFKVRKCKNYNQLIFSLCGNLEFLNQINSVLQKYCDSTKNKKPYKSSNSSVYYLEYAGNKMVKRIFDFLYKDNLICLNRKYNKGFDVLYDQLQ